MPLIADEKMTSPGKDDPRKYLDPRTLAKEIDAMQTELRIQTTVLPGSRVEFISPELPEGANVEVIVVLPAVSSRPRMSMLEFLKTLPPGPLGFKTPAEVDAYLQEERDAWDR